MQSSPPQDLDAQHHVHDYHQLPLSDLNHGKSRFNKYAFFAAILASTNSILLGYDIGVMSGAVLYIKDDLKITSTQVEILIGTLNLCSLIGSLAAGKTSDSIGRRCTIVLAAATFFMGAVLMGLAPSFTFLMVGRVVAGIGVGYSLMIGPVYTAEISPTMTRGFLSSLPEVFINFGILLGYVSNFTLSSLPQPLNWRLMLGLAALPAVFVSFGAIVMPESPRWLVMKGRFLEAKRILIQTSDSEMEADVRLAAMVKAAESSEQEPTTSNWQWHGQGVWKELLRPTKPVQRILIAAIGINFFMQASGNDAIVYYSPRVFEDAGIHDRKHQFLVTIIMGVVKTSSVFVSALFLDHYGRRPLLLLSTVGVAISLACLGLGSSYLQRSYEKPVWAITLCIVAVCADFSFFSIGLGPITWVYCSEIFPMRLRAQGLGMAISVNRIVSGIVSMTFLSVSNMITFGGMFFVLSGIMVVGSVFFYLFLPETKGKSLEEIETIFEDKRNES